MPYAECCEPFHRGVATAPTAERLMRSRYSAFAVGDAGYLRRTWHPATQPARLVLDPDQRWTRLEIVARTGGGLLETEGTVEFRAHHTRAQHDRRGRAGVLHENSRFRREAGGWLYVGVVEPGGR
jgi:SEC-C motif-containing protein